MRCQAIDALDNARFHSALRALEWGLLPAYLGSNLRGVLGRRNGWGSYGYQINVAPHAFAHANVSCFEKDQARLFAYSPAPKQLSYEVTSEGFQRIIDEPDRHVQNRHFKDVSAHWMTRGNQSRIIESTWLLDHFYLLDRWFTALQVPGEGPDRRKTSKPAMNRRYEVILRRSESLLSEGSELES